MFQCVIIILVSEKAVKGFLEDFFVWGVQVMISLLRWQKRNLAAIFDGREVLGLFYILRIVPWPLIFLVQ